MFVLSSIWEGFGYVITEALSLGIPTVATDCPSGPAEILENGKYGMLIEPGDSARLGHIIYEMLRNPELHKHYAQKADERISEFTIKGMADKYADLIYEVVNGKR
jgi:glycosyltransferase involved in cell wall biosynthesis